VIVVGAGVAGLAAAWSARRAGREVTLVSAGPGASALGSGAVDDVPWEHLLRAARLLGSEPRASTSGPHLPASALAPDVAAFAAALGLWDVPESTRPWLATAAGRIRPARGRDRAMLDLARLEDTCVILPRAERAGWDADALAATLAGDRFARARRLTFRAVDVPVLRLHDERRIADGDLAARHDEEARLGWLAARLREGLAAIPGAGAVLLGPFLGARAPRAEALSAAVGLPVGEALVGVGSPAGLRFEAARDALLDAVGARRARDRVVSVLAGEDRLAVALERGGADLKADAVVLAIGGLAGGGVIYAPPEHAAGADLPPGGAVPFALSVKANVTLSLGGAGRMDVVASLHGPELDVTAWPIDGRPGALETVGVRCEGARAAPGIWAAGDVVAGRPRTVLEAVAAGIAAGVGGSG
jgi:glycerol-3-phosphate dehydrogenase subunit B